jgi:hypothetical protein
MPVRTVHITKGLAIDVLYQARRWVARQKALFFTLSPSELRMLAANEAASKDNQPSTPVDTKASTSP